MGWVISLANEWEDYSNYFSKGLGLPEIGPHLDFSSLMIGLRIVMVCMDECVLMVCMDLAR